MEREAVLSPNLIYSARPTIRIGGEEYPKVAALLQSLQVTEQSGGLSTLELVVSNVASLVTGAAELAFESGSILDLGAEITVYAGDENAPSEIFRGLITGLEGDFSGDAPPSLTVLAEDRLQLARMARRTAVYTDLSIADLADRVANRMGLTPVISGFDTPMASQAQLNESDLAFLRRLLDRHDGDLQVVGDELHVSPRGDVARGSVVLTLGSQLQRARVLADLAHQVTEVTATGWDNLAGRHVEGTGSGANLGPGRGITGADKLAQTLGNRREQIAHLALVDRDEADAVAAAAFDQQARRFVRVEGTADGNPALRVGTTVKLQGLGPRFDNSYYVVEACHRWDQQEGYATDFRGECAYLGEG